MNNRVFVSSTSVDLGAHREAVRAGIQQLGARDVSMESFGARDERPKDECLRLIRDESDFFVGIYAHRYGFVPESDRLSITEAEYDEASALDRPRLIYLVNESAPWPPPDIDRGEAFEKLAAFKRRLVSRHICKFFASPDELRAYVVADLGREILRRQLQHVEPGDDTVGAAAGPGRVAEWRKYREGVYADQRDIFLVHTITPSDVPGQLYDCFIYLSRHQSSNLSEVERAEFFLGSSWRNEIFEVKNTGGPIGILTSAFGTFLCTCRITFADGTRVMTSRYIDFESATISQAPDDAKIPISSQPPDAI